MTAAAKAVRRAWLAALEGVSLLDRDPAATLPGMLEAWAERGDRPALLDADTVLTYAALARRVRSLACWAAAHCGGQTVGLLARNSAGYAPLWLGLSRAGCTVALLNHQLGPEALAHAVRAAGCRLVIAETDLAGRVAAHVVTIEALADLPAGELPPLPSPAATALLIYTSGTTGLPKAARLTHRRVLEWALWFAGMMRLRPEDRIYDPLPLYHSTGGVVAIGAALVAGASVRIASGFSARAFWDDVTDAGCSVFFYIGELCRYLLAAAPHPRERAHRLRLACGNGLQAGMWEAFQQRFAMPQVLEFYAATEGSLSLYNVEGKPGAVGRVPGFLQARFPLALIRVDPETLAPVRGADGLCVPCRVDEAGEALARLDPARPFDGYTDAEASAGKLLRDVAAPGDRWFRSGDLLRQDAAGFLYFVDRLGDTFRWKGENVSASEVAAAIRACGGVDDAVVFGVRVPGQEGRAGMAAVVAGADFELQRLWERLQASLPAYAQPVFLRLCRSLDLTGTFKLSASRLAAEGYRTADPVFVRGGSGFEPCDAAVLGAIDRAERRF